MLWPVTKPAMAVTATVHYAGGRVTSLPLTLALQTADEVAYFTNGGILPYMLRQLMAT